MSPSNWAQSFPAPQLEVCKHGVQSPRPPLLEPCDPLELCAPLELTACALLEVCIPLEVCAALELIDAPAPAELVGEPVPPAPPLPLMLLPPAAHDAAASTQRPTKMQKTARAGGGESFMARNGRVTLLKRQAQ